MKKLLLKNICTLLNTLFIKLLVEDSNAMVPKVQKNNRHINTKGLNVKDSTQFNLWNKIYDLVPPQNAHWKLKYEIEGHCEGGKKYATIKKKERKKGRNLNHILFIISLVN